MPRQTTLPPEYEAVKEVQAKIAKKIFANPMFFLSQCMGIDEQTSEPKKYVPTQVQETVLKKWFSARRLFVNKYRQAKVTTATLIGFTLPRVMFTPGIAGALIADTDDTAKKLMKRLIFAHKNLPSVGKLPFVAQNEHYVEFPHGGHISIVTAGANAPGIGQSEDVLDMSELCAWQNAVSALSELMPGLVKRPNAFATIESTPGQRGSYHYDLWIKALESAGDGFWFPLFLKWWEDPTCYMEPKKGHFQLNNDEARLIEEFPFLKLGHIAFMRWAMSAGIGCDDYRRFRNKYPLSEYDGWIGDKNPKMPEDAILKMINGSRRIPEEDLEYRCCVYEKPIAGEEYIMFADPNSYGAEGDPAGMTLFKRRGRVEVACFSGREDPGLYAHRLAHIGNLYNRAIIVVESNAAACIATLQSIEYSNIYWTDNHHPGWYATTLGLLEAEADTVQALRENDITILSKPTLHQGLEYDGSKRTARDSAGGHFDMWRTIIMACWCFKHRIPTWKDPLVIPSTLESFGEKYDPEDYTKSQDVLDNNRMFYRQQVEYKKTQGGIFTPISRLWTGD